MRAREPDLAGTLDVDGISIHYESFGAGDQVVLLMPTWCVVHSRAWKLQVPYLSRHFRVVTWDGPGNGESSRPSEPAAYTPEAHARYALAVLDALGIDRVVPVASSGGTHRTLRLAADHPDRVGAIAFIGPLSYLVEDRPAEIVEALGSGDLGRFLRVFMGAVFTEPHSTKAFEDGLEWGRGTTMEILVASLLADAPQDAEAFRRLCEAVRQPVVVIHGDGDRVTPPENAISLAGAIGDNASLVTIEGGGHRGDLRDPVPVARLLRDFVRSVNGSHVPSTRWPRATNRAPRALYISSPIGLGHARRDVAIASELRKQRPDLQLDWLAQDPTTRVLENAGERVHPASRLLANECAHWTSEASAHELPAFQAWRRMDEILTANFMVLHDVLEEERYDLVIGDEAWEVDHYLHENPELKRGAFAWLTDFVGWLPTDDGPEAEAELTADYNAEMIEHVDRYPWVRDRAIFVGNAEDVVPHDFGPGLPSIRDWTEENFEFAGYVSGVDPSAPDREAVRAELGLESGERLCVATVGGSGVGTALLQAVVEAFPLARRIRPDLRLVVVAGPRIDPWSLEAEADGLSVVGYVPELHRILAACDLAIIQGGLTTAMELTAGRRPFLYFPLRRHFEQQIHVPHRLDRYRSGRRMDLEETEPESLAAAIIEGIDREPDPLPVGTDGARRAAALIAELI